MKIVGGDLHARQQTIAMVDTETGEFTEKTLSHEGNAVRIFYAGLAGPVVVGIGATGAMQWFLELLEELSVEYQVGHPAKIRAKETRKQKHDRRDAGLLLELLVEGRFPEIWMPSTEQRDLRTLLRDRHQWVRMRSRLQHRRSHSITPYEEVMACGAKRDNVLCKPYHCRPTLLKDERICSVCIGNYRNGSRD